MPEFIFPFEIAFWCFAPLNLGPLPSQPLATEPAFSSLLLVDVS
jgi:hypothetical protein